MISPHYRQGVQTLVRPYTNMRLKPLKHCHSMMTFAFDFKNLQATPSFYFRAFYSLALILIASLCFASFSIAQDSLNLENSFNSNNDDFLPVEQAYQLNLEFQTTEQGTQPILVWMATDQYYLYKHGFKYFFNGFSIKCL